jgi:hypothetical protein
MAHEDDATMMLPSLRKLYEKGDDCYLIVRYQSAVITVSRGENHIIGQPHVPPLLPLGERFDPHVRIEAPHCRANIGRDMLVQ